MLIYDGDCGFCTASARQLEAQLPLGYPVVAWQDLSSLDALGLTEYDVRTAAYWIDVAGQPQRGHRAVAGALIACKGWRALGGRLLLIPPISWLAAGAYWLIARYRYKLPGAAACKIDVSRD